MYWLMKTLEQNQGAIIFIRLSQGPSIATYKMKSNGVNMKQRWFSLAMLGLIFCGLGFSANAQELTAWQTADIGFSEARYYVHTPLRGDDPNTELAFQLCSPKTSACLPITSCWYRQDLLEDSIATLSDSVMRSDLRMLLNSSFISTQTLEKFFPALAALLGHLKPSNECKPKALQILVHQLEVKGG